MAAGIMGLMAALHAGPGLAADKPAVPQNTRPAPGGPADTSALQAAPGPAANLDRLFERLGKVSDETEGAGIGQRIEEIWLRSGSPTADLLLRRAMAAGLAGDTPLAIHVLDRVVAIRPQWAEAWHRRSMLFSQLGDDQMAASDLQRTLALEPRHYAALSALGMAFYRKDDYAGALKAWRASLALNPHQPEVKRLAARLTLDVDGRDL